MPLPIGGGPAGIAIGAALLLFGKKKDPCDPHELMNNMAHAAKQIAGGASKGAAAGPYGMAALGGAAGLGSVSTLITCGLNALNAAKQKLCDNASSVADQMASKGVPLPGGFGGWSCDQKIAFIAAFGPFAVPFLLGGALLGATAKELGQLAQGAEEAATNAVNQVGAAVSHAAGQVEQVASGQTYVGLPGGGGFNI